MAVGVFRKSKLASEWTWELWEGLNFRQNDTEKMKFGTYKTWEPFEDQKLPRIGTGICKMGENTLQSLVKSQI